MIFMLDEIVEKTKQRIEDEKKIITLDDLKNEVSLMKIEDDFPFKRALMEEEI